MGGAAAEGATVLVALAPHMARPAPPMCMPSPRSGAAAAAARNMKAKEVREARGAALAEANFAAKHVARVAAAELRATDAAANAAAAAAVRRRRPRQPQRRRQRQRQYEEEDRKAKKTTAAAAPAAIQACEVGGGARSSAAAAAAEGAEGLAGGEVMAWLRQHGLSKYCATFQREEVFDLGVLRGPSTGVQPPCVRAYEIQNRLVSAARTFLTS